MLHPQGKIILGSVLLTLAAACGDSDNNNGNNTGTKTAALSGRIDGSDASRFNAAGVTLYRVESSGALTAVSDGTATVDQSGKYHLTVDVTNGPIENALIQAKTQDAQRSVLVAQPIAEGPAIAVAPMNAETTAEADVELSVRGSAQPEQFISRSLIRAFVTDQLAAQLEANDRTANVKAAGRTIASGMTAWRTLLTATGAANGGVSAEQVSAALADVDKAQATFDAALDASADRSTAEKAYLASSDEAYASAGIQPAVLAAADQAMSEAMRVYAREATGSLENRLIVDAESARAASVTMLVEAQLTAMHANDVAIEEAKTLGATLRTDVAAAFDSAPAELEADLATAWSAYAGALMQKLELSLPLAERVKWLEVELAAQAAQSTLMTTLDSLSSAAFPATTGSAAANAMIAFRSSVLADANLAMLTTAGLSADEARARLEILYALAVATRGEVGKQP